MDFSEKVFFFCYSSYGYSLLDKRPLWTGVLVISGLAQWQLRVIIAACAVKWTAV